MRRSRVAIFVSLFALFGAVLYAQKLPDRQLGFGFGLRADAGVGSIAYALSPQFHLGAWMGLEVGAVEGESDVNIFFAPYGKYFFARIANAALLYGFGAFFLNSISGQLLQSGTDAGLAFGIGIEALIKGSAIALYGQAVGFRAHFGDLQAFYLGWGMIQLGFEVFLPR